MFDDVILVIVVVVVAIETSGDGRIAINPVVEEVEVGEPFVLQSSRSFGNLGCCQGSLLVAVVMWCGVGGWDRYGVGM